LLVVVYHNVWGRSNLQSGEACDCSAIGVVLEWSIDAGEVAMTGNKGWSVAILVVGLVVLLGSALADILGLGASPLVFGYRQLAGSAVGLVLVVVGAVLYWRAGRGQ
jgi:hypothetical protein